MGSLWNRLLLVGSVRGWGDTFKIPRELDQIDHNHLQFTTFIPEFSVTKLTNAPSLSLRRSNAGSAIFFPLARCFLWQVMQVTQKSELKRKRLDSFAAFTWPNAKSLSIWCVTFNHFNSSRDTVHSSKRNPTPCVRGRRASPVWLRLLFQHTRRQTKFLSQSESGKFCGAFVICYVNEMFLVLFAPAACYAQHE